MSSNDFNLFFQPAFSFINQKNYHHLKPLFFILAE